MTIFAKLVAKEEDLLGYVNYVFEVIEEEEVARLGTKYILATRYPNWNHRKIELNEIGYLDFMEIQAGVSKWFDGEKMIPYNYNGIQFNKFIPKPREKDKNKYIM